MSTPFPHKVLAVLADTWSVGDVISKRQSMQVATIAFLIAGFVVLVAVSLASRTSGGSGAVEPPAGQGCESATSIEMPSAFTAYEDMRSHGIESPLPPRASPAVDVSVLPQLPGTDEPLRVMAGKEPLATFIFRESTMVLYGSTRLTETTTFQQFIRDGGVSFTATTNHGGPLAAQPPNSGPRGVEVAIAERQGVLIWADPISTGTRPHHLYWSSSNQDFRLVADMKPETIVNIARALTCAP